MKTNIPYGVLEGCRFPLVPLGAIANFTSGWTPSSKNPAYYGGVNQWATIADLNAHYISDTRQRISNVAVRDAGHPKQSKPGDLLFSFKLSVGMASIVSSPMYTNEAIATFRPSSSLDIGFAYYAFPVFLSAAARPNIYGAPLLSASLISRARVPRLSLIEQRRIADYLDEQVQEIDFQSAQLNELIDNLRVRSIVSRSAQIYSDSCGAERKLWSLVTKTDDASVSRESISLENMGSWNGIAEPQKNECLVTGVPYFVGDVLFGKLRPYLAKVYRAETVGVAVGDLHVYKAGPEIDSGFLKHLLLTSKFIEYAERCSTGVKMPRVEWSKISQFRVPLPALSRQFEIADRLDRETAETDFLIKEATELIENLKARKTALITEVVTGRKKV